MTEQEERDAHLRVVWNTLMFFAVESSYTMGERTGGVLQGCPRKPPPMPHEMAGYARRALESVLRYLGREPDAWMLDGTSPAAPAEWQPIDTAPKDGAHILACNAASSFGYMEGRPLPPVQTVVHYWPHGDAPGFYTSVNELEPQRPFEATHWKPLDAPTSGVSGPDHQTK